MLGDVRLLDKNDWQAFSQIRLEALQEHPGSYWDSYAEESKKPKEYWQDYLSQKDKWVFGIFYDQFVGIGAIFADDEHKQGCLGILYIQKPYREMGLGKKLIRARVDWAAHNKPEWTKVVVGHRHDNDASHRLIETAGFTLDRVEEPTRWADGTVIGQSWYGRELHHG